MPSTPHGATAEAHVAVDNLEAKPLMEILYIYNFICHDSKNMKKSLVKK